MIDLRENVVDCEVSRWSVDRWRSVGIVRMRPLNPQPFTEHTLYLPLRFRWRGDWYNSTTTTLCERVSK